ncbi:hypothetical protein TRVL_04353 [Trypanosoma vivax]|nr:hypothetical protein TRVL_04353 [Trypanosoma vivax]
MLGHSPVTSLWNTHANQPVPLPRFIVRRSSGHSVAFTRAGPVKNWLPGISVAKALRAVNCTLATVHGHQGDPIFHVGAQAMTVPVRSAGAFVSARLLSGFPHADNTHSSRSCVPPLVSTLSRLPRARCYAGAL